MGMRTGELGADGQKLIRRDTPSSVLVIEQDAIMLTAMGAVLDLRGHLAVLARNYDMALDAIQAGDFDAIVLSIDDVASGCQFAKQLRASGHAASVPVIYLVPSMGAQDIAPLATEGGVYSITKPFEPDELVELVEKVLVLPHLANGKSAMFSGTHLPRQQDWVSL